ncbi:hypothetical protein U6A24_19205 [Aquimarina gracilis]|uniref:TonB family protein n=1 Tax=Aquimarina gracilis TaxID=874422 RepID=A0ABU6A0K4_9FLAO|nr:hypothetical protein [Aquimarina gracilis]MEB3347613.1 hypothetical protein [Aquimarina gracilis]
MEFIEKHKALIITSMLMGIFVLSLYNINMIKKQKEQSEILMEIPEEFLAEQEEEQQPEEELIAQENRQLDPSQRTHNAYNEDFEDHDEIEERIKSLMESEELAQSEETLTNEDSEVPLEDKENEEAKKEEKELEEEETNNRNSSLTYNLKGRKALELPNPVYTCNGNGKVVVKIEVNKNGYVIDAKVDKKASTTRNECLFDNAMEYARQALFSRTTIEEQEGSITYYFNYSN